MLVTCVTLAWSTELYLLALWVDELKMVPECYATGVKFSFLNSLSSPLSSPGLVPEQEDEGQAAETLLALASSSGRPARGTPDWPRIAFLQLTVPLHPAPPPTPSSPPPLPPGSLHAGILTSQPLRYTY